MMIDQTTRQPNHTFEKLLRCSSTAWFCILYLVQQDSESKRDSTRKERTLSSPLFGFGAKRVSLCA
ncbi:MAG TPA: hypothetical protein VHW24_22975, partial [Bryobacteraceae bacterium]|nr:hypothetical protein [Bryobacteraceae bacterium]